MGHQTQVFIGVFALLLCAACTSAQTIQGSARVIDGDTLDIAGTRIRLSGIDTPETRQACYYTNGTPWPCGQQITQLLTKLVANSPIVCDVDSTDRYGRSIATCYLGQLNLNREIIARGWGLAYRRYSTRYIPDENDARANRRGIWQGLMVPPWNWRKGERIGG